MEYREQRGTGTNEPSLRVASEYPSEHVACDAKSADPARRLFQNHAHLAPCVIVLGQQIGFPEGPFDRLPDLAG